MNIPFFRRWLQSQLQPQFQPQFQPQLQWQSQANTMLLLAGIFLLALAVRVVAIAIPINTDEVPWMLRGVTFLGRLLKGDLGNTYIVHHPGFTNLWLISTGMVLNCLIHKLAPALLGLDVPPSVGACLNWVTAPSDTLPIALWIVPRLLQAVVTSLCMVGIFGLTRRLLGHWIALGAIALLLFEPFFLAYQRYLTTDAMQNGFATLGLLALLCYLRDGDRRLLAGSGTAMGLAIAGKITALCLLPGIALWVLLMELGVWRPRFAVRGWRRQVLDFALWGLLLVGVIVALCPALWVAPVEVAQRFITGLGNEANRGNFFFWGKVTDNPGVWYYPMVFAYRLSPAVQFGLLALVVVAVRERRQWGKQPELMAVAIAVLSVVIVLSSSKTQVDRYINLIVPELAILAAVGWWAMGQGWLARMQRPQAGDRLHIVLVGWLVLAQLSVLLPRAPYYLSYYNPLLGGAPVAQQIFAVGWGEGLDQAAAALNRLPQAETVTVASWYPGVFGAYFKGKTLPIRKVPDPPPAPWTQAHRVVLYGRQRQFGYPTAAMLDYFALQPPMQTIAIAGVDYAKIYPGPMLLPEDLVQIPQRPELWFGQNIRLLGYEISQSQLPVSTPLLATFYWSFQAPPPPDSVLYVKLRHSTETTAETEWSQANTGLLANHLTWPAIAPRSTVRDVHTLWFDRSVMPGRYQLELEWSAPSANGPLDVMDGSGKTLGKQAAIATIELLPLES